MISNKTEPLIEQILNLDAWKLIVLLNVVSLILVILLRILLPNTIANVVIDYRYNLILVPLVVSAFIIFTRILFKDSIYSKQFVFYASMTGFSAYGVYISLYLGLTIFNVIALYIWVVLVATGIILHTINTVRQPMKQLSSNLEKISEGDFTNAELSVGNYGRELVELQNSYNTMVKNTLNIVSDMKDFSSSVQNHSEYTAKLLKRSTYALEEIQSIMSEISGGADNQSQNLQKTIKEVNSLRQDFDERMSQISNVANTIESIASQVNMLALNASIEAARAGEYGRGFAVVAENINQLAGSAKNSLGHITTSVDNLNSNLNKSISTIEGQVKSASAISDANVSGVGHTTAIINDFVSNVHILDNQVNESIENAKKLSDSANHFKTE